MANLFDELQKGVKIIDNGKELEFGRLIIIIDNKENKTEFQVEMGEKYKGTNELKSKNENDKVEIYIEENE